MGRNALSRGTEVELMTKPYLKKYLNYHLKGMPLSVNMLTPLGVYIHGLLRRKMLKSDYDDHMGKYKSSYTMSITDFYLFEQGVRNLTSWAVVQINGIIDSEFKREMYTCVSISTHYEHKEVKEAVSDYMVKYDLCESDIPMETLMTNYKRIRKRGNHQRSIFLWPFN